MTTARPHGTLPQAAIAELERLLHDERPETHEQDAALAWQLVQQAHSVHPEATITTLWETHTLPHLTSAVHAIEQTLKAQQLPDSEQRALRTWLHGRTHHHVEHLRIPTSDTLTALLESCPRWSTDQKAEEQIAALASLPAPNVTQTLQQLEDAAGAFEQTDRGWWRVAVTIADQEKVVDLLTAHAAATGEGPPGADIVRRIHLELAAAHEDPHAAQHPSAHLRRAADEAANLPRHWRILLLAGPDPLLWIDLLNRSNPEAHLWRPEGDLMTAEDAERKVHERLSADLLARDVAAHPFGSGFAVHLEPLPDDLPGLLPVYVVRRRGGSTHRLDPETARAARAALGR